MSAPTQSTPTPRSGMPVITANRQEPAGRHRFIPGKTPAQWHAAYFVAVRRPVAKP